MANCVSVDNMAQLRDITTFEGMVNVKGFSSIGDGGGGNFIWDPASSDEDNNGTIIIPNKPKETKGRWIRQFFEEINVRWFGAVGDGVTPDTHAIQDAWKATWDEKKKRVYRLIFPSGTYNVTTLSSAGKTSDGKIWNLPSAYLEGIGKVIITSPNSLGKIIGGYTSGINEIINFDKSCGPASVTNIIFQGISTSDAGFVQYSEGGAATLPSFFNPAGQNEPYNHRAGIHYQGTDAIICKNVEVSNMPYAGLLIDKGIGQSLIEDSYFHGNGLYNIYVYPGVRDGNRVLQGGSIKLIHTRIENSIPVSWGYISYGINMGGCDFTAFDCDFVNNIGSGLSNDDANPSTMSIDNCRFVFGKNHGKLSFPKTYDTAIVSAGTNIVHFTPFFISSFQKQGGYGISIPGVFWSLVEDPLEKNQKRVLSSGTAPPKIKITGTANQSVILKIKATWAGELGDWRFKYSTDNGLTHSAEIPSAEFIPLKSSNDDSRDTGLTLNISPGKASLDNVWTADNTYSYFDPNKVDTVTKTILTEQKADTTSASGNTSLAWVVANTSTLLVDNGTCQNFSCTNSFFNGGVATTHQFAAIRIKGHEYDPDVYHRELESQRVVKIIGNTFDTFDVDAVIHSLIWGAKEIRIQNNVFVDSPFSQCIVHEPGPDPFDLIKTFDEKLKRWVPAFDKKAISKIVHLSGNTYVDVGRVYLGCGGLININDETVIYTGTEKLYSPTSPHFYILTPSEPVNAYPGRVGRVIRRNNTISGQNPAKLYYPSTTSSSLMDPYPTWWSWHEGDREEIEVPGARNYSFYGFNGSTSTKEGHETELTVAWLPLGRSITDQFQTGAEISMPGATWGGGFPHVALAAVDRTKGVGQVCARTALPADKKVSNVGVLGPTPFYYGGRICTAPGTFGGCTAHATTSAGNYSITITDDVLTLCPQQIISIAGVTFTSPNAKRARFTEIVDVIGHEGYPGSIIVRDAPNEAVTGAAVSFVPPTLVLYDKIASTGVAGGAP